MFILGLPIINTDAALSSYQLLCVFKDATTKIEFNLSAYVIELECCSQSNGMRLFQRLLLSRHDLVMQVKVKVKVKVNWFYVDAYYTTSACVQFLIHNFVRRRWKSGHRVVWSDDNDAKTSNHRNICPSSRS
jgi:hypothetical protein